ncbi:MAG: helix-turn-helix transcriptional regulator [Propionibacteriaceae bacterium]|nr:helix-turn-helix transcriptional regulator [Propionibacteriaceae bacterium]
MTKSFDDLAKQTKAAWNDDTRRVYEAASAQFAAEVNNHTELGAAISAARRARALTQTALSEITGIQQAEISRIERGLGNPTATTLFRLAEAVGQQLTLTGSESVSGQRTDR